MCSTRPTSARVRGSSRHCSTNRFSRGAARPAQYDSQQRQHCKDTAVPMSQNDTLFTRAQAIIPGGVNSPVRAFRSVGGTPRFITRGEGPYVFDADGKRYIDYVGSWGPMIVGHAHPAVIKAVQEAAARGLSFGMPTEDEIRIAEEVM